MSYQFKGLQISFIIHAVIFIGIIGISKTIVTFSKPIVIDFSINSSQQSAASSQKSEPRTQKPEVRKQKSENIKTEQKTEPHITNTHPSPISETQVPVPYIQPRTDEETKNESRGLTASNRTGSSPLGDKKETGLTSAGDFGNSEEKVRIKYLKKHFAYIRDRILKNLSYPQMARRMGWEGKVTVSFVVCENGYVEDIKIMESSGFGLLDKNAVEAIRNVCPFPKPPVRAEVILPIVYRLN